MTSNCWQRYVTMLPAYSKDQCSRASELAKRHADAAIQAVLLTLLFTLVCGIIVIPSPSLALDATDSVVHLHLNESTGATEFHDNIGGNSPATCSGGSCPAADATGVFGTAISCDGNNDFLDLGNNGEFDVNFTVRTVMFWFQASDTSGTQMLYDYGDTADGSNIYLDGNQLTAGAWSTTNGFNGVWTTHTITAGQTYHVALVIDADTANQITLFVDGVNVDSDSITTQINRPNDENALCQTRNGTRTPSGTLNNDGERFEGMIDEYYVFDRALGGPELLRYVQGELFLYDIAFEEAAGATTFVNSVGGYADASCSGSTCPTAGQATASSLGVTFDGSDDRLSLDSGGANPTMDLEFSQRTVAVCFNSSDLTENRMLFEEGGGTNGLNIFTSGAAVWAGAWSRSKGWDGDWDSATITEDEWHHAAIVFDAARDNLSRLYVDGALAATFDALEPVHAHTGDNKLGGNMSSTRQPTATSGNSSLFFAGTLDQFHLSDRLLSASEITTLASDCLAANDVDVTVSIITNPDPLVAGETGTFTLTTTNSGTTGDANGTTISSSFPSSFQSISWSCSASGGASCGAASGSGDVSSTADLPPSGQVVYSGTYTVDKAAVPATTNATASVDHPADTNASNDDATTPVQIINETDVAIQKVLNEAQAIAGEGITYVLTLTNGGPSNARAITVTDTLPASLTGGTWTCAATGTSACGAPNGTGSISTTADIVEGETVQYTITSTLSPTATGTLSNTATVLDTEDTNTGNDSATSNIAIVRDVRTGVTKQTTSGTVVAGGSITYQIDVTNVGSSTASAVSVTDTFDSAIEAPTWTCSELSGGLCGANSGSGNISESVTVPNNGTVRYTINATVASGATGQLANTASISHPEDTTGGDNVSIVQDTVVEQFDASITSTINPAPGLRGKRSICVFIVSNLGPSDSGPIRFQSSKPGIFEEYHWSCTTSNGANSCPSASEGDIDETFTLVANSSMQFDALGVLADTSPVNGSVDCVGSIDPGSDLNAGNNNTTNGAPYSTVPD